MNDVKQHLVTDNMNLVYYLIDKYYPTFVGNEEVMQEGMLGLCKAADTYDESKSVFSTYACTCILNQIKMWFRNNKKHNQNLSLDYTISSDEGEVVSFMDTLVGSEDVDYIDYQNLFGDLSDTEKTICELLKRGYNQIEIGEKIGKSRTGVNKVKRRVESKVRNKHGDY